LAQGETPLVMDEKELRHDIKASGSFDHQGDARGGESRRRHKSSERRESTGGRRDNRSIPGVRATPLKNFPGVEMKRFRLDVGRRNQVKPSNIVGAIANEAELESKYIGEIEIRETYSTVDLPADMPKEIMAILRKARVGGRPMELRVYTGEDQNSPAPNAGNGEQGKVKPARKSYNSKHKNTDGKKAVSDYAIKKRKQREK
ncbi:MAG: hypothetical protein HKN85_11330, partial [Gammaproteobacteria bacterium]|nr:hypothetical protein [Gammaproteobacteria bacterium]